MGDPGEPLIKDKEDLRQMIWKNWHLVIDQVKILFLQQHEELYAILMFEEQTELLSEDNQSRLNFARN